MARRLVLVLALVHFGGGFDMASADGSRTLAQLTWLLGRWEAVGEKTTVFERWAAVSTESWEGYGETRKTGAPEEEARVESETLRLLAMGDEVFYLAKVAHNDLPIAFRLVDWGEDHAVFENPAHDFPRRLEYRLEADALEVRVSDGEPEGKGFTLRFQRR